MKYDYLIVGAGLFGAVFAHEATKVGKSCLVIDKRNHIAGNIYCENIISEYGDMDNQSKVVKEFIKRGLIFKITPKFLFKKIMNIFGF